MEETKKPAIRPARGAAIRKVRKSPGRWTGPANNQIYNHHIIDEIER